MKFTVLYRRATALHAARLQFDRERFELELEQRENDPKEFERESALDSEKRRLERD